jgi:hypothetical protein
VKGGKRSGRKEGRTVKEERKMKHGGCRKEQEERKEGKRTKEEMCRKGVR